MFSFQLLNALLRRQPFQRFRVWISERTSVEVRHPELAAVTDAMLTVRVPADDGTGEIEVIIALFHITKVEVLPLTA